MNEIYQVTILIQGQGDTERQCFDDVQTKLEHSLIIWEYDRIELKERQ